MTSRLLSFLALALCLVARGASESLPDTFAVEAIDAYLESKVREASRVGLSAAIVKNGRLVLARGYGKRSLESGQRVSTNTLFAIGSISKQFTCAAILLLAEDGRLTVHDRVAKFFPDLTRAQDITLLDLMQHTSGYPDYYPLDYVDRRMKRTIEPAELLRQYAGGKLDFEPGSQWSYSNTGYILLGEVVEKVVGESMGDFLQRRIFGPLEMTDSVYEPRRADSRIAQGYTTFALSDPEPVEPEAAGWIGAAGGIYSTPRDLAKWNLALIDGKVLKPDSYALMTAPRKLSSGKMADYGCGLSLRAQAGRQILSHNGAVAGFNASSAIVPSTRSSVILMGNLDGALGPLPAQLLTLLLKEPAILPIIDGPPVVKTVETLFSQLQRGKVNRKHFSADFNEFLTDQKLKRTASRLKRFGKPIKSEVLSTHERGGMEVTTTRLTFKDGTLRALMYRKPDGVVEQFFVSAD